MKTDNYLRNNLFAICGLMLLLFCMSSLISVRTYAATLDSKETFIPENGKTIYRDLNGDGKKEKIRFILHMKKDRTEYIGFSVYVNGKRAIKKSVEFMDLKTRYISCSTKKSYIQIVAGLPGDYMAMNIIYSLSSSGTLVEAADLGRADDMYVTILKVTANSITVKFSVQPYETGRVEWNFVYIPSGQKLKLKSNIVDIRSCIGSKDLSHVGDYFFIHNQFFTSIGRTYYTSTNLRNKSFTTEYSDIVTLKKVKIVNKKMYLKFSFEGKDGWIKMQEPRKSRWDWYLGVYQYLAG